MVINSNRYLALYVVPSITLGPFYPCHNNADEGTKSEIYESITPISVLLPGLSDRLSSSTGIFIDGRTESIVFSFQCSFTAFASIN